LAAQYRKEDTDKGTPGSDRLVNLAVPPPGVKFKQSAMPFVQMENISHFLRACQSPPLNLQEHDMFLTVDLYEQKDPAQVLQCLSAFSRAANSSNPTSFPTAIGPRNNRGGVLSPQLTGPASPGTGERGRGMSNASNSSSAYGKGTPVLTASKTGDSSGRWSPTKSPTHTSWSKKEHEGTTAPAWNIAQYGYMGGASQGNLGISFGGRRQITSAGPYVPNMADKERKRKEAEAEAERQRQQMEEEEERRRKAELEAEEERARQEEERRWEQETRRAREEERRRAEEEKRKWEEEERQWKLTEERRRQEEEEAEARLQQERQRSRSKSDARLRGQFLSQYQADQESQRSVSGEDDRSGAGYTSRVQELEKELELARKREAEYERERQERSRRRGGPSETREEKKARSRSRSRPAARPPSRQDSWSVKDERGFQRSDRSRTRQPDPEPASARSSRPLPDPSATPPSPTKVKTHRTAGDGPPAIPVRKHNTGSRPLPDPNAYASTPPPYQQQQPPPPQPVSSRGAPAPTSRTDRYLASNPPPQQAASHQTYSREVGGMEERDGEDRRRNNAQKQTKAGGFASKSLLEREMEMERQRQREWEEAQKETAARPRPDGGVDGIGGGMGGRWDVGQWSGYTGGDSQNRGGQGIGAGRRQIVGPRPLPGSSRN
jgi:hypothetical protein